jgi:hypothetical protein
MIDVSVICNFVNCHEWAYYIIVTGPASPAKTVSPRIDMVGTAGMWRREMLKLGYRNKWYETLAIITDAMRGAGRVAVAPVF